MTLTEKCDECGQTAGVKFYGLTGLAMCVQCYNAIISKAITEHSSKRSRAVTVKDLYRVDRSAVERQLGHPIKRLAPWKE